MSSREWVFRIHDILAAISKIESYTEGMTKVQFNKDVLVQDAVTRNFEVIGEAAKHIPEKVRQSYPDIPWQQMSSMRNILIHEYFGVDFNIIWHTSKKYLPDLKSALKNILENQ